jgi:hypothetical protein
MPTVQELLARLASAPAAPIQTTSVPDLQRLLLDWDGGREVLSVVDGDTADVEGVGRVRLTGLHMPEVGEGAEHLGPEMQQFARTYLQGRKVKFVPSWEGKDAHGRALGKLFLEDGTEVNTYLSKVLSDVRGGGVSRTFRREVGKAVYTGIAASLLKGFLYPVGSLVPELYEDLKTKQMRMSEGLQKYVQNRDPNISPTAAGLLSGAPGVVSELAGALPLAIPAFKVAHTAAKSAKALTWASKIRRNVAADIGAATGFASLAKLEDGESRFVRIARDAAFAGAADFVLLPLIARGWNAELGKAQGEALVSRIQKATGWSRQQVLDKVSEIRAGAGVKDPASAEIVASAASDVGAGNSPVAVKAAEVLEVYRRAAVDSPVVVDPHIPEKLGVSFTITTPMGVTRHRIGFTDAMQFTEELRKFREYRGSLLAQGYTVGLTDITAPNAKLGQLFKQFLIGTDVRPKVNTPPTGAAPRGSLAETGQSVQKGTQVTVTQPDGSAVTMLVDQDFDPQAGPWLESYRAETRELPPRPKQYQKDLVARMRAGSEPEPPEVPFEASLLGPESRKQLELELRALEAKLAAWGPEPSNPFDLARFRKEHPEYAALKKDIAARKNQLVTADTSENVPRFPRDTAPRSTITPETRERVLTPAEVQNRLKQAEFLEGKAKQVEEWAAQRGRTIRSVVSKRDGVKRSATDEMRAEAAKLRDEATKGRVPGTPRMPDEPTEALPKGMPHSSNYIWLLDAEGKRTLQPIHNVRVLVPRASATQPTLALRAHGDGAARRGWLNLETGDVSFEPINSHLDSSQPTWFRSSSYETIDRQATYYNGMPFFVHADGTIEFSVTQLERGWQNSLYGKAAEGGPLDRIEYTRLRHVEGPGSTPAETLIGLAAPDEPQWPVVRTRRTPRGDMRSDAAHPLFPAGSQKRSMRGRRPEGSPIFRLRERTYGEEELTELTRRREARPWEYVVDEEDFVDEAIWTRGEALAEDFYPVGGTQRSRPVIGYEELYGPGAGMRIVKAPPRTGVNLRKLESPRTETTRRALMSAEPDIPVSYYLRRDALLSRTPHPELVSVRRAARALLNRGADGTQKIAVRIAKDRHVSAATSADVLMTLREAAEMRLPQPAMTQLLGEANARNIDVLPNGAGVTLKYADGTTRQFPEALEALESVQQLPHALDYDLKLEDAIEREWNLGRNNAFDPEVDAGGFRKVSITSMVLGEVNAGRRPAVDVVTSDLTDFMNAMEAMEKSGWFGGNVLKTRELSVEGDKMRILVYRPEQVDGIIALNRERLEKLLDIKFSRTVEKPGPMGPGGIRKPPTKEIVPTTREEIIDQLARIPHGIDVLYGRDPESAILYARMLRTGRAKDAQAGALQTDSLGPFRTFTAEQKMQELLRKVC